MYYQNNMPARTRMSHYLRTGQKIDGFQPDSYKSPVKSVAKVTRTVRNNQEKIVVTGGRYVTVTVQNFQIFVAPLRATLSSFPLDANDNRITVFQNNPEPFIGHLLPLVKRTYGFDAGPVGDSYRHVLIVSPDTRATGADFIVNVTLEARD